MAQLLDSNVTGSLIVSTNTTTGNISVTSNVATGNISVTQNIANAGNILVTSNITTGNISVTSNVATGNITLNDFLYISNEPITSFPATANTLNVSQVFAQAIAGRMMPSAVSFGSRVPFAFQPFLGRNHVGLWLPPGNATTVPLALGLAAPTANGTATARTVATTNALTRTRRLGYVSAAAVATQAAGYRQAANQFTMGTGTGQGGFFYVHRFAVSDAVLPTAATATMFVGLNAKATLPANGAANTVSCVGVGQLAGSNNFFFCYGGSAAQPAINLGTPFFANNNSEFYELAMYAPSTFANTANTIIYYRFEKVDGTGANVAVGSVEGPATVLPANTVLIGLDNFRSAGTQVLATGIDLISLYIDSDYT